MLENKDYCDYDTCVALVDLGMRITSQKVYSYRDTLKHSSRGVTYTVRTASAMGWVIAIPLYEAQKWLREEKKIYVTVGCPQIMNEGLGWSYEVCDKPWNGHSDDDCLKASGGAYDSYEEALSEGIKEAVKILKEG